MRVPCGEHMEVDAITEVFTNINGCSINEEGLRVTWRGRSLSISTLYARSSLVLLESCYFIYKAVMIAVTCTTTCWMFLCLLQRSLPFSTIHKDVKHCWYRCVLVKLTTVHSGLSSFHHCTSFRNARRLEQDNVTMPRRISFPSSMASTATPSIRCCTYVRASLKKKNTQQIPMQHNLYRSMRVASSSVTWHVWSPGVFWCSPSWRWQADCQTWTSPH